MIFEPAHKTLIDRYLNWDLVRERLWHYKNISKFFTMDDLQSCANKAPFYCHYLGWRLGTWESEYLFDFFDNLLANASSLPNWSKNKILRGCEFQNFWTLLWELQVAELFANYPDTSVEWTKSGPDLRVRSESGTFYVECTTHPQSFGLEEFINELLNHIDSRIEAKHVLFNKFSLPNNAIEPFLDELFKPLLDDIFLQEKIKESEKNSPIRLPTPKSVENLYVFIENENAEDSNSDQPWITTGLPDDFISNVVQGVIEKKRKSNKLELHKPNILAVNLLLGDFQTGRALRTIPTPNLGTELDAAFFTACGIDEIPSLNNGLICFYDGHPIKGFLNQ